VSLRGIPVHERGRPSKRLVLCGLRRCGLETACSRLIRTWRKIVLTEKRYARRCNLVV